MIYLIIATICFSLSFGIIKTLLTDLPSEFIVFNRLLLAGIIFLPFSKFKKGIKEHIKAGLIGVIQFGIMYLCFINAFKYLQGNEIALLTTSTPLFVLIWSTLLGERFRWIYLISIIISIAGAVIILCDHLSFEMMLKGILLMECSNCSFALGQVLWKKYLRMESAECISSAYLGAGLLILPSLISYGKLPTITISQLSAILYLGIVPTGLGFWLWNKGSKFVKYTTLALMNNLKIPVAVIFSIIIFKEQINTISFIIGISIMTLAYIILQNRRLS